MRRALANHTAGTVQASYALLGVLAVGCLGAFGHLGAGMGAAIGDGGAATGGSAMALSQQAGVAEELTRLAIADAKVIRTAEGAAAAHVLVPLERAGISRTVADALVRHALSPRAINRLPAGFTAAGRDINCPQVTACVDLTLGGHAASALPQGIGELPFLHGAMLPFGSSQLDVKGHYFDDLGGAMGDAKPFSGGELGARQLISEVAKWGPGAKGVVTTTWDAPQIRGAGQGHVYNVANVKGRVVLMDSQQTYAAGELHGRLAKVVWGQVRRTQNMPEEIHDALARRLRKPSRQAHVYEPGGLTADAFVDKVVPKGIHGDALPAFLDVDVNAALKEKIAAYPGDGQRILSRAARGRHSFTTKELATMVLRQRSTRLQSGKWILNPAKLGSEHLPLDAQGAVAFHAELANARLVPQPNGMTQVLFDPTVVFTKAITMEDAMFAAAYHHGALAFMADGNPTLWLPKEIGDRLESFTSRDLAIAP